MHKFLAIAISSLVFSTSASMAGSVHTVALTSSHQCSIPGSVYIDQLGACVLHITDVDEMNTAVDPTDKHVPVRMGYDPKCDGHPSGWKYDLEVVMPNGDHGIEHRTCD